MIYFISALSLDWFVVRYLDSDLTLVPNCVNSSPEERFRDQEQPIVQCWVFDITGRPSDELKHVLRKLQANDPGGAKRRRILTYLTKVRTLCARAYGAPTIRGQITDSYLSFLPTRVH